MNTELTDLFNEGFAEFSDDLGETFTLSGTEYTGIISNVEFESSLFDDGGGRLAKLGTSIVVCKLVLPAAPSIGALMLVRGKRAKVEQVKDDEVSYEITAVTSDK